MIVLTPGSCGAAVLATPLSLFLKTRCLERIGTLQSPPRTQSSTRSSEYRATVRAHESWYRLFAEDDNHFQLQFLVPVFSLFFQDRVEVQN